MQPTLKKITFAWGIHLTPHPHTRAFLCPPLPPTWALCYSRGYVAICPPPPFGEEMDCTVDVAPACRGGGDAFAGRDGPLDHYTNGPAPKKCGKNNAKNAKKCGPHPPPPPPWLGLWPTMARTKMVAGGPRGRAAPCEGVVGVGGGRVGGPGTQRSKSLCTKKSQINKSFCKRSFFPTMKPGSEGRGY